MGADDDAILQQVKLGLFTFKADIWKKRSSDAKDLIKKMLTMNPSKRITALEALKHPWMEK